MMDKNYFVVIAAIFTITASSIGFANSFIVANTSDQSQIYFIVNGTTGYTGILTPSPTYALDVVGTINALNVLINGSSIRSVTTSLPLSNITGSTSQQCYAGQFLRNITLTNGAFISICVADAGYGGVSGLTTANITGDLSAWNNKIKSDISNVTGDYGATLNYKILLYANNITGDLSFWNNKIKLDWTNITNLPPATTTLPITNITGDYGTILNYKTLSYAANITGDLSTWNNKLLINIANTTGDYGATLNNKITLLAQNITGDLSFWNNKLTIAYANTTGIPPATTALPIQNITGDYGTTLNYKIKSYVANITDFDSYKVTTLPYANITGSTSQACGAGQKILNVTVTDGAISVVCGTDIVGGNISGSGIVNYLVKWTAANTTGTSIVYDDGTNVGIGTASPTAKLQVIGATNLSSDLILHGSKCSAGQVLSTTTNGTVQCVTDTNTPSTTLPITNITGDYGTTLNYKILSYVANITDFNSYKTTSLPYSNITGTPTIPNPNGVTIPAANITGDLSAWNNKITLSASNITGDLSIWNNKITLDAANITAGTLAAARGGTGISGAGGAANRVLVTTDGSSWSAGQITAAMISNGAISNANLANSSLTVTAGTGLTGGGLIALGGSTTLNIDTSVVPRKAVDETVTGRWTFNNDIVVNRNLFVLGNITNTNVNNLSINGSLLPPAQFDNIFNIGSPSNRWASGYFGTDVVVGGNSIVTTVTGAGAILTSKSGNTVTIALNGLSLPYANITGTPTIPNPNGVTIPEANVTNLVSDLAGKQPLLNGISVIGANVTGDLSSFNNKITLSAQNVTGDLSIWNNKIKLDYANLTNTPTIPNTGGVTLPLTNITGSTSQQCSAGQYLRNITLTDGSFSSICVADAGYGGVSLPAANITGDLSAWNNKITLAFGNITGTIGMGQITDSSIGNNKLANASLTVTAGTGLTGGGLIALGSSTTLNLNATLADGSHYDSRFTKKSADETVTGRWTFNNDIIVSRDLYLLGNLTTTNVNTLSVNGSILPPTQFDNTFDLGSSSARWRTGYFGTGIVVNGTATFTDTRITSKTTCGKLYTDSGGNVLCGSDAGTGGSTLPAANITGLIADQQIANATNWNNLVTRQSADNTTLTNRMDTIKPTSLPYANITGTPTIPNPNGVIIPASNVTAGTFPSGTFAFTGTATNNALTVNGSVFVVNGTSGNVGIGTTSPGAKLHVRTNANGNLWVRPGSDVGFSDGIGIFSYSDDSGTYKPLRISGNPVAITDGNVGIGETSPGSKLSVSGGGSFGASYDTTAAPSNGLIIEGNVGIGTTNPTYKLDVAGNINGSGLCISGDCRTAWSQVGGSSSGAGWTNDSATTSTALNVNVASGKLLVNATSGNVGIGTTGPQYKLDVGSSNTIGGYSDATHFGSYTPYDGAGFSSFNHYWGAGTGGYKFKENGMDLVTILNSGNVGIGTTTPGFKLEIAQAAARAEGVITTYSTTADQGASIYLRRSNNATLGTETTTTDGQVIGEISSYGIADSFRNGAIIKFIQNGAAGTNRVPVDIAFFTTAGGVGESPSERMRIDKSGNVGIGTTSPGYKLEVDADSNNIGIMTAAGSRRGVLSSDAGAYLTIAGGYNNVAGVKLQTQVGGTFYDRLTVQNDGNVGIGTTAPSQKLQVQGATLMVNNSGSADVRVASSSGDAYAYFDGSDGDFSGSDYFWMGQANDKTVVLRADQLAGSMSFQTGTGGANRMTYTQNGNLGINSTNPTARLEVAGSMNATSAGTSMRVTDNGDVIIHLG